MATKCCKTSRQAIGASTRGPVSRVLSSRSVSLAGPDRNGQPFLLATRCRVRSSNQPGRSGPKPTRRQVREPARMPPLFGLAPGGVYHAAAVAGARGALLPHPFTLAAGPNPKAWQPVSGLLSVALSLTQSPKTPRRRALPATLVSWSPDFPRRKQASDAAAQPPGNTAPSTVLLPCQTPLSCQPHVASQ